MQTSEKSEMLLNAQKHFYDQNFDGVELFGAKLFEAATTPAEVVSLLSDNRRYVIYSPDSSVTNHLGLDSGAVYAKGSNGSVYKPLTEEVLLSTGIAQATGIELNQSTSAQQVIDYVLDQKTNALTRLGDGILENAQYESGFPIDLLPLDGNVDENTVYFAIVDAGSVIGGETMDSVGFVYGMPSDSTRNGVTWRVIDPFDGLSSTSTVSAGDTSLATADAVYQFVTGITDMLSTSVQSNTDAIGVNTSSILSHTGLITALNTSVSANAAAIVEKQTAIDANAAAIVEKQTAIDANATAIVEKQTAIDANATAIVEKQTAIDANASAIVEKQTAIDANASAISNKVNQDAYVQIVIQEGVNYTAADGILTISKSDYDSVITAIHQTTLFSGGYYNELKWSKATNTPGEIIIPLSRSLDLNGDIVFLRGSGV